MYIFGRNVALETLKNREQINQAYIIDGFNYRLIIDELKRQNIKTSVLSKKEMDFKVSGLHQGIILDVPDYRYASLDELLAKEEPLIIILDHLEDPHNFGAIIRTAEAAGVDGIIIPCDRSVEVNGTVIKTSVGTAERMKIVKVKNLVNTIKLLKKEGFWIFGTDMEGVNYTELDYKGRTAIVCGNEGSGLSHLVRENCDLIASIPMKGTVNSLNVSVATAIIVFEAIKMRGLK